MDMVLVLRSKVKSVCNYGRGDTRYRVKDVTRSFKGMVRMINIAQGKRLG